MSESHPIPTHCNFKNLAGRRYGRLVVTDYRGRAGHNSHWLCRCDCGNEKELLGNNLVRGLTRSCGCLRAECTIERQTKHGASKTPVYYVWKSMINRCYRPSVHGYARYGGRGITVCDRWRKSFANFAADMGERPKGYSIERRDNNGSYCPENCCWATKAAQHANRCNSVYATHNGETKTIGEWVKSLGLTRSKVLTMFGMSQKRTA